MPTPAPDDPPDPVPRAAAAPAEFVGPPRPIALTPLGRKPRRVAPRAPSDTLPAPLKRLLLIGLGLVALATIVVALIRVQQRAAGEAAAQAARQAIEQLERDNQQRAEAERQAAAQRQRLVEAQEQARVEGIRAEQLRAEEAQQNQISEAERRQRAWAAYYRKPSRCNEVATLECANHYIRARRIFDDKFARGEL
jgi:uncharacterized protein HemX